MNIKHQTLKPKIKIRYFVKSQKVAVFNMLFTLGWTECLCTVCDDVMFLDKALLCDTRIHFPMCRWTQTI